MSQFDSKAFTGGESITDSQFLSYIEPQRLSSEIKNMEGDVIDKPIKYAQPKYSQVKKTYKVLEPITKETIVMPERVSKNVRQAKPVFMGKDGDIPLPTASVMSDLCKTSYVDTGIDSKIFESKNEPEIIKQSNELQFKNQGLKNSGVGKPTIYEGDFVEKTQAKNSNIQTSIHESKRSQASRKSNIEGRK